MEPQTNGNAALALRGPVQLSAYEPKDINEALSLAKQYSTSKLTKCRTPEQALLIMATGHELGIPATTALRMIYVADFGQGDQVTLSADLMVALCQRSPLCEYFRCVESTEERAVYATKRKGDPERQQAFTNEDRIKAKLGFSKDGKESPDSNWAKYRSTMLKHRAASMLAREVFSDVVGGFYTEDEAREIADGAALGRHVGPAVTPLPTATRAAAPIVEADVVGGAGDEARIVAALEAATVKADVDDLAKEALRIWPKERPEAVKQAHLAAKARVKAVAAVNPAPAATPTLPFDEKTGEVAERVPGEEG